MELEASELVPAALGSYPFIYEKSMNTTKTMLCLHTEHAAVSRPEWVSNHGQTLTLSRFCLYTMSQSSSALLLPRLKEKATEHQSPIP